MTAQPDPDFEVVEMPGAVLLVGSSNTGFEMVNLVGFKSELLTKLADRLLQTSVWRH